LSWQCQQRYPASRVTQSRPGHIADSVREFAPDVNRGVSCQIARLCTRAPAKPGPGGIFDPAMRTPSSKQHVTVRARTRCRLAVLPRDRLGSQALPGAGEQQTSRLRAHNTNPAGGDPWVLTNPLPGPTMAAASLCLARFARRRTENETGGTGTPSAPPGWRRPRSRLRRTRRPRSDHRRWRQAGQPRSQPGPL
jgi:hypothetical protein